MFNSFLVCNFGIWFLSFGLRNNKENKKMESLVSLVKELISGGYLKTPNIIEAFKAIDRADFVLPKYKDDAYENVPLLIGYGQTISQPLTVAFMLELLEPAKGQKILDIGSGSGWQTALLAYIAGDKGKVFGIERIPELVEFGRKNVDRYGFIKKGMVKIILADGSKGLESEALFDRIIAGAMAEKIPEALKKQLEIGGRLVTPAGGSVWLVTRKSKDEFEEFEYPGFVFVPMIEN